MCVEHHHPPSFSSFHLNWLPSPTCFCYFYSPSYYQSHHIGMAGNPLKAKSIEADLVRTGCKFGHQNSSPQTKEDARARVVDPVLTKRQFEVYTESMQELREWKHEGQIHVCEDQTQQQKSYRSSLEDKHQKWLICNLTTLLIFLWKRRWLQEILTRPSFQLCFPCSAPAGRDLPSPQFKPQHALILRVSKREWRWTAITFVFGCVHISPYAKKKNLSCKDFQI